MTSCFLALMIFLDTHSVNPYNNYGWTLHYGKKDTVYTWFSNSKTNIVDYFTILEPNSNYLDISKWKFQELCKSSDGSILKIYTIEWKQK